MSIPRCFLLLLCAALAVPLQGLGILQETEEVEYVRYEANTTAGGSVTLDCGAPAVPSIFIWAFAAPGSDKNLAVAYDYGHGPRLQAAAERLGRRTAVVANTSSLLIEEVRPAAGGTYTCQALHDMDDGAKVVFYFTRLRLEEED